MHTRALTHTHTRAHFRKYKRDTATHTRTQMADGKGRVSLLPVNFSTEEAVSAIKTALDHHEAKYVCFVGLVCASAMCMCVWVRSCAVLSVCLLSHSFVFFVGNAQSLRASMWPAPKPKKSSKMRPSKTPHTPHTAQTRQEHNSHCVATSKHARWQLAMLSCIVA